MGNPLDELVKSVERIFRSFDGVARGLDRAGRAFSGGALSSGLAGLRAAGRAGKTGARSAYRGGWAILALVGMVVLAWVFLEAAFAPTPENVEAVAVEAFSQEVPDPTAPIAAALLGLGLVAACFAVWMKRAKPRRRRW